MSSDVQKFLPTVNVPFVMQLKYIDLWPNDTTKNKGKGYGPSLALRGDIGGVDSRVYPKGFADANIDAMVNAGIIAAIDYDYDPTERYSIDVKDGDITITLSQPAGEKYAKTVFSLTAQRSMVAPPPRKPNNVKGPHEFGPPLPGEYDGEQGHALRGVGHDETPFISPSERLLLLHDECFRKAYNRLKKANEAQDPVLIFTGSDVLAYTAQLFIAAERKGLVTLAGAS